MPKITVVIPAYNEASRIEKTINNSLDYFSQKTYLFEIVIVNDGSTDETAAKVQALTKETPNSIRLISHRHSGKAAAVRAGVEVATGDLILMMDADGAIDITELEKLISKLKDEKADIAFGSREGKAARRLAEPFYRHLLGRVFNRLVKIITGLKFEDTQCGFKLFKASVIKHLARQSRIMNREKRNLKDPLVSAFDVELLLLAQRFGYKAVEVPIVWRHVPTQNVNPIKDSFRMLADVIKVRFNL